MYMKVGICKLKLVIPHTNVNYSNVGGKVRSDQTLGRRSREGCNRNIHIFVCPVSQVSSRSFIKLMLKKFHVLQIPV